jgi:ParB family chromosome partitioning protein
MTRAVQKITVPLRATFRSTSLCSASLTLRRVKAGVSIEQLAESIAQLYPATKSECSGMAKNQPGPCVVREGDIAEDDSLAENDERVGLHPLDQFRAFNTLSDTGFREEDIAAVSPAIVKERLRLAAVSPKLHEVYAEDGMGLEQLMAFSADKGC